MHVQLFVFGSPESMRYNILSATSMPLNTLPNALYMDSPSHRICMTPADAIDVASVARVKGSNKLLS